MIVWNPGKLQSHKIEDLCMMLNYTLPCTNLLSQLKYYSSWLPVSSQLYPYWMVIYLIIRKYNELSITVTVRKLT